MTNTPPAATCPHSYCLSGICSRYTPAERAAMKADARRYLTAGDELRGRVYDGATFLVEDGEARVVYNRKTRRSEIVAR